MAPTCYYWCGVRYEQSSRSCALVTVGLMAIWGSCMLVCIKSGKINESESVGNSVVQHGSCRNHMADIADDL
jgi:hypothetical protein